MLVQEVCEKCHILRNASTKTKAKMISYGILKSYRKGELIFREREEVQQFYFLADGCIALYKTNRNHDRKVVFVYGSGEMLNEVIIQEPIASISCYALTDVLVLSCSRKQFLEMMEGDFELTKLVMDSLSRKLRRCYHQLGNTSNAMCLDRQVASKLWKLGMDFGEETDGIVKINFELSITFLADMVGSKRETVSRVVKKLTGNGLLIVEKKYFYITDMDALREYVINRE